MKWVKEATVTVIIVVVALVVYDKWIVDSRFMKKA